MYLSILRVKLADMPRDLLKKEKRVYLLCLCEFEGQKTAAGADSLYHMGSGVKYVSSGLVVVPSLNECSPGRVLRASA